MTPLKFIHGVNTSDEQVRANVEWALAQDVPELQDRRCVILGGGPSAKSASVQAALNFLPNRTLFTLNNSWQIPYSYAVDVNYVVMMDARPENAEFVSNILGCRWLVASQCHRSVFEALNDSCQRVAMWHVAGSPAVEERGLKGIPGGGTVLTHTLNIAVETGYTHITMAGVDSSFEDAHHAYSQLMNDDDKVIEVATPADTKFKTTPELAAQASYMMTRMLQLERQGITFEIIGDGLLPTLWREHNELRANPDVWEPQKYQRMWNKPEYRQHSPAMAHIDAIQDHIGTSENTVIDFGCGQGDAANFLTLEGCKVIGIDFAANAPSESRRFEFVEANLWALPESIRGDVGICIDVMEHIPPEKVDDVLRNIARAVPKCIFAISYQPDSMGALIGQTLHMSVHPESWWLTKLKEHFGSVSIDNGLIICEVH